MAALEDEDMLRTTSQRRQGTTRQRSAHPFTGLIAKLGAIIVLASAAPTVTAASVPPTPTQRPQAHAQVGPVGIGAASASGMRDRLNAQRRQYIRLLQSQTGRAPRKRTAATRADLRAGLAPAATPMARSGANMAYDQASHQLLMFGGDEGALLPSGAYQVAPSNDTWVYSGGAWMQLLPAHAPPRRVAAAMAYDGATQQVILFGGGDCSPCTDTWAWD